MSMPPASAAARTTTAGFGVLVAVLAFLAFWPAYAYDFEKHEGFVWDDDDHYLLDPIVHADDGWWRAFLDPQPGIVGVEGGGVVWNYWPLTRLSLWADLRLFGRRADGMPNLQGSHVLNVAFHAANAVLLLLVLQALGLPGAPLAAAVFAVHPVTTESVAWITERNGLLSAFWVLVTMLAWLRFRAAPSPARYGTVVGAFLLALLAKTTTVMLPVVLVLIHEFEQRGWTRRDVARLAPLFAMSLVAGITSIVFEGYIGSRGAAFEASFAERLVGAGRIPWFYFGKIVWPSGLSFNYPRWAIDPGDLVAWAPGLVLAAIGGGLCVFRRHERVRGPFLGVGVFVATLFPLLGFFNVYGMRYAHVADHWNYLASIPVIAMLAAGAARGLAAPGRDAPAATWMARAAGAALLLVLASLTWAHASAFTSRETLWRHTLEREPGSYLAHNNLGTLLLERDDFEAAIAHYEQAIAADPTLPEPYVNVGNALDRQGDPEAAAIWWQAAIERDPEQGTALFNLAVQRIRARDFAEGDRLLVRALEARPQYEKAFDLLARLYRLTGREHRLAPFVERARQAGAPTDDGRAGVAWRIWAGFAAALAFAAWVARGEAAAPGGDAAAPMRDART